MKFLPNIRNRGKARKIAAGFLSLAILCLGITALAVRYDAQDLDATLGEVYQLDSGWLDGDGKGKEGFLPLHYNSLGKVKTLWHEIDEDWKGLSLNLTVNNAAVKAYIGGKPFYEAGFSNDMRPLRMLPNAGRSVSDGSSDMPGMSGMGEVPGAQREAGAPAAVEGMDGAAGALDDTPDDLAVQAVQAVPTAPAEPPTGSPTRASGGTQSSALATVPDTAPSVAPIP